MDRRERPELREGQREGDLEAKLHVRTKVCVSRDRQTDGTGKLSIDDAKARTHRRLVASP